MLPDKFDKFVKTFPELLWQFEPDNILKNYIETILFYLFSTVL